MSAGFDFSRLTIKQKELLSFQGWGIHSLPEIPQPLPRTVKKLIERGLVVEHKICWRGMTVIEYEVPISVHIAWCAKCAKEHEE
jgi:hypothetical protein